MEYTTFVYWASMTDEDKQGKFMAFEGLGHKVYDDIISTMPAVGTPEYLMVPLDCIDLIKEDWILNVRHNAVEVIDVKWIKNYTNLSACNFKSL